MPMMQTFGSFRKPLLIKSISPIVLGYNELSFTSQSLARLLYKAAREGGYVDPRKIEEILGVSQKSLNNTASRTGNVQTEGKKTFCTPCR